MAVVAPGLGFYVSEAGRLHAHKNTRNYALANIHPFLETGGCSLASNSAKPPSSLNPQSPMPQAESPKTVDCAGFWVLSGGRMWEDSGKPLRLQDVIV